MRKNFLLFFVSVAMIINGVSAQTTWFDQEELSDGASWSGICGMALKGSNTEDNFKHMGHGDKYQTIGLYAGHQIRIDAGYVNLDSVIVYMYSNTTCQAPLLASDGTDLTYEKVTKDKLNHLKAKWENPGTFVGVLTLTVGEKATLAADEANRNKKGEAEIYQVDVYASEELGACGVPKPTDSVTIENPSVSFTRVGDLEFDNDYVMEVKDSKTGCVIHYPFSMIWEECEYEWGDGDKHDYELKSDATVQVGTETVALEYGKMTVQQNTSDATKYDFHIDVIGANGTRYFMDWTGTMVAANALFDKEPMTPTTINFEPAQAIYDTWVSHHQIMIYLKKDGNFIQLNFVADKVTDGTIVALGTYAIDDEDEKGSVRMSEGFEEGYENEGSAYYINPVFEEFGGWKPETAYFFKSGTVKVESSVKGVKITVDATSHYGSTIHAVYEGGLTDIDDVPLGVESLQPSAVSIQKVLRDGQLYLMYKGTMYNVLGKRM